MVVVVLCSFIVETIVATEVIVMMARMWRC